MIVLAKKLLSNDEINVFQQSAENSEQLCAVEIQKIAHLAAQNSANLLMKIINRRSVSEQSTALFEKNLKKSICNLA